MDPATSSTTPTPRKGGEHLRAATGLCALAVAAMLAGREARAQPSEADRTRYSIGAVLLVDKDGYRGVGAESLIVPGVAIRNKWVDLFGPQLDLRLLGNERRTWWIGPRIEYRFDGYEQSDSAVFSGMSDRKGGLFYGISGSFELGAGLEVEIDHVKAARRDAGFDRGAVGSIQLSRSFARGAWTLVPRVGLEYQSSRYVDYYYGVRPSEATAVRPAYSGKGTYSPELGLLVRWRATPQQFLFANFNHERYAKAIRNSPLITSSGIPQVVLGYQYVFD
jgi:outer membrane protein